MAGGEGHEPGASTDTRARDINTCIQSIGKIFHPWRNAEKPHARCPKFSSPGGPLGTLLAGVAGLHNEGVLERKTGR